MESRKNHVIWYILFGLLFTAGTAIIVLCTWYHQTYNVGFKELLYTLLGPLEGAGNSVVRLVVNSFVPPFFWTMGIFLILCFLVSECRWNQRLWTRKLRRPFPRRLFVWLRRIGAVLCTVTMAYSLYFVNDKFDVLGYIHSLQETTTLYEDEYVDPNSVAITAPEDKRNLIYIYVESLETSYTSASEGGLQEDNLMPRLTALAEKNLVFSGTDTISGMRNLSGTSWTMASLLAQTAGIPFAFPVDGNAMDTQTFFAPKMVNLGNILEDNGYTQEFLCGSDASFAGRLKYFTQHGNYEIFDLFTAREKGYIAEDYYEWWGYEDRILFDIARDEALRLASAEEPFNLTILTVDLHHLGGYVCAECENNYFGSTADVVNCTDRLVTEFVSWCQQQPFYKDTTLIIAGDHPRMDTMLVEDADDEQRTLYNCFINEAAFAETASLQDRVFTALDMFPTTLAALGFDIEGDRLGLGVNLFSGDETLAERMGVDKLDLELNKHSNFYLRKFYYVN